MGNLVTSGSWWEDAGCKLLVSTDNLEDIKNIIELIPQRSQKAYRQILSRKPEAQLQQLYSTISERRGLPPEPVKDLANAIVEFLYEPSVQLTSPKAWDGLRSIHDPEKRYEYINDCITDEFSKIPFIYWIQFSLGYRRPKCVQQFLNWIKDWREATSVCAIDPGELLERELHPLSNFVIHAQSQAVSDAMEFLKVHIQRIFDSFQPDILAEEALPPVIRRLRITAWRLKQTSVKGRKYHWSRVLRDFQFIEHVEKGSLTYFVHSWTKRDCEHIKRLSIDEVMNRGQIFHELKRDWELLYDMVTECAIVVPTFLEDILQAAKEFETLCNMQSFSAIGLSLSQALPGDHECLPSFGRTISARSTRDFDELIMGCTLAIPMLIPFMSKDSKIRPSLSTLGYALCQFTMFLSSREFERFGYSNQKSCQASFPDERKMDEIGNYYTHQQSKPPKAEQPDTTQHEPSLSLKKKVSALFSGRK